MLQNEKLQIATLVDHAKPQDILEAVREIVLFYYPPETFSPVERLYEIILDLFNGDFPGYQGCSTEYHDLTHTLDVFLAAARLVDGLNYSEIPLTKATVVNLLCAALMHDSGYIKIIGDNTGTGAKYTKTHVQRSCQFIYDNGTTLGFSEEDKDQIAGLISCTGLSGNAGKDLINSEDIIAGNILGTADLLGQMADRAYLEKLLFLYYEFKEAGFEGYDTEFDILRKTLDFYVSTQKRLDEILLRSYRYARTHFKIRYDIDENLYIIAIERQMTYLKEILKDHQSNFRSKLKRIDLDKAEKRYKVS